MTLKLGPLTLTDPVAAPTYGDGPISRWCRRHLADPRDEVFVRMTISTTVRMVALIGGLAVALYVGHVPPLAAAAVYLAVWGWTVPPVILMLHNTMHRSFVRAPRWLNRLQAWGMSLLLGIPAAYAEHHLGMHHAEDNMQDDLSSTLRYRRDSFLHFLAYFGRFLLFSHVEMPLYLSRHGRGPMTRRMMIGEYGLTVFIALVCWVAPPFGVIAFLLPTLIIRFMMMAGNWGQHAFINTARPNDGYSNSITCVNSGYNQRCFNDGYHIGHHLKANRHWTDMPRDLADNYAAYVANEAIVFEGVDFFLVSLLLWTGQWKMLARRFVRLDGKPRSDEDVIAMLKSRVHPVREWAAEALAPAE
jgi:fatty acid desaturase